MTQKKPKKARFFRPVIVRAGMVAALLALAFALVPLVPPGAVKATSGGNNEGAPIHNQTKPAVPQEGSKISPLLTDKEYMMAFRPQDSDKACSGFTEQCVQNKGGLAKSVQNEGGFTKSVQNEGGLASVFALEFSSTAFRQGSFPDSGKTRIRGVRQIAANDRFADIFVTDAAAVTAIEKLPGLVWADSVGNMYIPPPPPAEVEEKPSRATPETIVRNGFGELKGKGVIIAIVDTGVDFRHPDFITYDAQGNPTSRITYLWDMGLEYKKGRGNRSPVSYPNDVSIGTVLTKNQLTQELRSKTPSIPSTDRGGHGTACASVAAGNGNADMGEGGLKRPDVVGVAPEADIIAVSLDADGSGALSGAFLINAVIAWLDETAGDRPLVISNSWGGHYDGHDGMSVSDRHLNSRFPAGKKGRALLFAAGNEGADRFHAGVNLTAGSDRAAVGLTLRDEEAGYPLIIRYYSGTDEDKLSWDPEPANKDSFFNPVTGQFSGMVRYSTEVKSFTITNAGKPTKVDLYLREGEGSFDAPFGTGTGTVGSPGTISSAITVGSYDWNDNFHVNGSPVVVPDMVCGVKNKPIEIGALSCYSSIGPTRDGRMKPEIVAPGQWYTSSLSSGLLPEEAAYTKVDTTRRYMLMNGTSAATPYAAGIVALMFEKKPDLTTGDVRRLLMEHASKDPFTSRNPGPEWGAGKLDLAAVTRIIGSLDPQ